MWGFACLSSFNIRVIWEFASQKTKNNFNREINPRRWLNSNSGHDAATLAVYSRIVQWKWEENVDSSQIFPLPEGEKEGKISKMPTDLILLQWGAANPARRKKGKIHARGGSVKSDKKWLKSWQMDRAFLSPFLYAPRFVLRSSRDYKSKNLFSAALQKRARDATDATRNWICQCEDEMRGNLEILKLKRSILSPKDFYDRYIHPSEGISCIQKSAKLLFPDCVYFCLVLPGWCLAKEKNFLADLCKWARRIDSHIPNYITLIDNKLLILNYLSV